MVQNMASSDRIAYIAGGRLFLKEGSAEPHEILCTFAENWKERMIKLHEQNDWKHLDESATTGALALGGDAVDESHVGTEIAAIAPSDTEGDLLYGLNTDDVAGIFLRPIRQNGEEKRLIHTNERNLHSLSSPDEEGSVICSISNSTGLRNLSLYRIASPGFTEITEGDSLDGAACWIPKEPGHLVYQSAGIGRNAMGNWVDTSPASIERLDTTHGKIHTLLSDPNSDFLLPQATASGKLYCIRRPYKHGRRGRFGKFTNGWLGAPFRLIAAMIAWLISVTTNKPLDTAGGPQGETPDLRQMLSMGNLINAQQLRDDAAQADEEHPDIVPKTWQLIETDLTKPSAATARVIAKGVLAFHVSEDGSVIYSNGNTILKLAPDDHKPQVVAQANDVHQLIAL